tara:strand:- start:387 stop:932 length:546 start_codon:yes stop_codon:yes gene_type:complete
MKIKKRNNTNNLAMSNQNIFAAINERINAKNLGATVFVPHCCNNNDVFSGMFAKEVISRYPIVESNFHLYSQESALGKTQIIPVATNKEYGHRIFFANMICQDRLNRNRQNRSINYAALCFCMHTVKMEIKQMLLSDNNEINRIEIHAPKFGTGTAGGDWKIVKQLIEDSWMNINTFIYSR